MSPLQIIGLVIMLFSAVEGFPLIFKNQGLSLPEALIASFVLMAIKLPIEVFFIRVIGIGGVGLLLKRGWQAVMGWLRRHNILLINNWHTTGGGQVVEIYGPSIGKLRIAYRRPAILMRLMRRRILKWIRDLGYLGLFLFSVTPLIPGVAIAVPTFYCLVTIKYKWYRFNNWWFVCFAIGCELRMIISVLVTYGLG